MYQVSWDRIPTELLHYIFEYFVDNKWQLSQCQQVCHSWNVIAQQILYKNIIIHSLNSRRTKLFFRSIQLEGNCGGQLVRRLTICCSLHGTNNNNSNVGCDYYAQLIKYCCNVEELTTSFSDPFFWSSLVYDKMEKDIWKQLKMIHYTGKAEDYVFPALVFRRQLRNLIISDPSNADDTSSIANGFCANRLVSRLEEFNNLTSLKVKRRSNEIMSELEPLFEKAPRLNTITLRFNGLSSKEIKSSEKLRQKTSLIKPNENIHTLNATFEANLPSFYYIMNKFSNLNVFNSELYYNKLIDSHKEILQFICKDFYSFIINKVKKQSTVSVRLRTLEEEDVDFSHLILSFYKHNEMFTKSITMTYRDELTDIDFEDIQRAMETLAQLMFVRSFIRGNPALKLVNKPWQKQPQLVLDFDGRDQEDVRDSRLRVKHTTLRHLPVISKAGHHFEKLELITKGILFMTNEERPDIGEDEAHAFLWGHDVNHVIKYCTNLKELIYRPQMMLNIGDETVTNPSIRKVDIVGAFISVAALTQLSERLSNLEHISFHGCYFQTGAPDPSVSPGEALVVDMPRTCAKIMYIERWSKHPILDYCHRVHNVEDIFFSVDKKDVRLAIKITTTDDGIITYYAYQYKTLIDSTKMCYELDHKHKDYVDIQIVCKSLDRLEIAIACEMVVVEHSKRKQKSIA